ncbi:hypothetical protein HDU97_009764 [Phlyctochytrium planicorne]|nr:hypothetical protein HDU97_009764 [Phlyctochytrium planicorne]
MTVEEAEEDAEEAEELQISPPRRRKNPIKTKTITIGEVIDLLAHDDEVCDLIKKSFGAFMHYIGSPQFFLNEIFTDRLKFIEFLKRIVNDKYKTYTDQWQNFKNTAAQHEKSLLDNSNAVNFVMQRGTYHAQYHA